MGSSTSPRRREAPCDLLSPCGLPSGKPSASAAPPHHNATRVAHHRDEEVILGFVRQPRRPVRLRRKPATILRLQADGRGKGWRKGAERAPSAGAGTRAEPSRMVLGSRLAGELRVVKLEIRDVPPRIGNKTAAALARARPNGSTHWRAFPPGTKREVCPRPQPRHCRVGRQTPETAGRASYSGPPIGARHARTRSHGALRRPAAGGGWRGGGSRARARARPARARAPISTRGQRARAHWQSVVTRRVDVRSRGDAADRRPERIASMEGLSEAQVAVYDRQLRVWGKDTQQRRVGARPR